MPRSVPIVVYWVLDALIGGIWIGAIQGASPSALSLRPTLLYGLVAYPTMTAFAACAFEPRHALRQGRPALPLRRLVRSHVVLPPVRPNRATAGELLSQFVGSLVIVLFVVHFAFPSGPPVWSVLLGSIALISIARLFVPTKAPPVEGPPPRSQGSRAVA